jgi:hypothetical protein
MITTIIIALIAFLIGRFLQRFTITISPRGDEHVPAHVLTHVPAPPEKISPRDMTDHQIYNEVFKYYIAQPDSCPWRSLVPGELRDEFRRRNMSGFGHNIHCNTGNGLCRPNLSL